MPGSARPLPDKYPDEAKVGPFRRKDIEYLALPVRMTITPGEVNVALWELNDGHPVQWIGVVFRIDAEPPGIYLNFKYTQRFTWPQRDELARLAAEFWMS